MYHAGVTFAQFDADFAALFKERVADLEFAFVLYGSVTNCEWQKDGHGYCYSFRQAGAEIAALRDQGESYAHFYCSSQEGVVHPEVKALFATLGYTPELDTSKWLFEPGFRDG